MLAGRQGPCHHQEAQRGGPRIAKDALIPEATGKWASNGERGVERQNRPSTPQWTQAEADTGCQHRTGWAKGSKDPAKREGGQDPGATEGDEKLLRTHEVVCKLAGWSTPDWAANQEVQHQGEMRAQKAEVKKAQHQL